MARSFLNPTALEFLTFCTALGSIPAVGEF